MTWSERKRVHAWGKDDAQLDSPQRDVSHNKPFDIRHLSHRETVACAHTLH
jgi:hypothetical protein